MAVAEQAALVRRGGVAPWARGLVAAPLGAGLLVAFYLGIVTWAQGWSHAVGLLQEDLWFIAPITVGFGAQVGLFVYMRGLHAASAAGVAVTAGSTGTSTGAMLACCAHHLADVLPVIGVSGAAVFLNEVKTPLAFFAITMNAGGVLFLSWRLRSMRRVYRRQLGVERVDGQTDCHVSPAAGTTPDLDLS
jgi:hypothetical protein